MNMKSKKDKKNLLYKVCKKMIDKYDITCAEHIYQSDEMSENSLAFVERICEIIGYCDDVEEPFLKDSK